MSHGLGFIPQGDMTQLLAFKLICSNMTGILKKLFEINFHLSKFQKWSHQAYSKKYEMKFFSFSIKQYFADWGNEEMWYLWNSVKLPCFNGYDRHLGLSWGWELTRMTLKIDYYLYFTYARGFRIKRKNYTRYKQCLLSSLLQFFFPVLYMWPCLFSHCFSKAGIKDHNFLMRKPGKYVKELLCRTW